MTKLFISTITKYLTLIDNTPPVRIFANVIVETLFFTDEESLITG